MTERLLHPDEYDLGGSRSSADSDETFLLDEVDFASYPLNPQQPSFLYGKKSFLSTILNSSSHVFRRVSKKTSVPPRNRRCSRRLSWRRILFALYLSLGFVIALIVTTFIFRPSYTNLPPHYKELRNTILKSHVDGRGNLHNEKVFIAVSLYDRSGNLAGGEWGQAVIDLINLIGKDNTFLSIYENESGEDGTRALEGLRDRVPCNHSIVMEDHIDTSNIQSVQLPDGTTRLKRIAYLAEVRNRALQPLDDDPDTRYDKLLYLNDVLFDPVDAAQLLFSTNQGYDGRTHYRAACAVDFINPFKFYDRFATRDIQGYEMGAPFFPWFTSNGAAQSRRDMLDEKDAVRVRSCWGGMVAFDARYFQGFPSSTSSPLAKRSLDTVDKRFTTGADIPDIRHRGPVRFRAEENVFWDSSECCLIHADIQDTISNIDDVTDSGVYMNPFVRTAYTRGTLSWLWITRRFERLYPLPHDIVNRLANLPHVNSRRTEVAGARVEDRVWVADPKKQSGGSYVTVTKTAREGGFCAKPGLMVVKFDRAEGEDGWEEFPIPTV